MTAQDRPRFAVRVHQDVGLAEGDRAMSAIVAVSVTGDAPGDRAAEGGAAEVLLVDTSTSMQAAKIAEARRAALAAVEALPDGTLFAIVCGTGEAELLYPAQGGLARASKTSRAEARDALLHLAAWGRTKMSTWLAAARTLFDGAAPAAVCHAILLTDGHNEVDDHAALLAELGECEGRFVCDTRGIGDGWNPDELRLIARVMRGSADSAVQEGHLAVDFERLVDAAAATAFAAVRIRIKAMPFTRLLSVKQVRPNEYDLTDRLEPHGELLLGSWAAGESRDYHLRFGLLDDAVPSYDQDTQLGTVEVVAVPGADVPGRPSPVLGRWTRDPALLTKTDPVIAKYLVQEELGAALAAGGEAFAGGDPDGALTHWRRAWQLATDLGNDEVRTRLRRVVDVDEEEGTVRLRPDTTRSMVLNVVISRVSQLSAGPSAAPPTQAPLRKCPDCPGLSPATARYCVECRHEFGAPS